MKNSIMVIRPYKWEGMTWVFDDAATGLVREAFVSGADDMLDKAAERLGADPETGMQVLFSECPFPGHEVVLEHRGEDKSGIGDIYYCKEFDIEGWFCPALLLYFPVPPKRIYAQFKKISASPVLAESR